MATDYRLFCKLVCMPISINKKICTVPSFVFKTQPLLTSCSLSRKRYKYLSSSDARHHNCIFLFALLDGWQGLMLHHARIQFFISIQIPLTLCLLFAYMSPFPEMEPLWDTWIQNCFVGSVVFLYSEVLVDILFCSQLMCRLNK